VNTLRLRLVAAVAASSILVAVVILIAVRAFSSEQITHLLMAGATDEAEARAMVDEYLGRVLALAAVAGVLIAGAAGWWLMRRILRPLGALAEATRRVANGDLAARVPEPEDRELAEVANAFNDMTRTLEHTQLMRRALIEDVAHELRTPLTTLRGYTEALADGVVAATPDMLGIVHTEIEHLTRLVEALDRLARDDAADQHRARTEVDLAAIAGGALALAEPELEARGVRVRVEGGDDVPPIRADPVGMGQVMANLVGNAVRHTNDGGEIRVQLTTDGAAARCSVANTGSEIPEDELPLIWDRLHRVDRSRSRVTGGAGIGLAIVRQIVTAHGGTVGATSGSGRTEVWFRVPFVPEGSPPGP
jgi:two-component system sensor histidine kinase BaeS